MNPGHTYIIGSNTGTLYIGVTSELRLRICQHKLGVYPGFSKKYKCHRLLLAEPFHTIAEAIAREKQLKGWMRKKKVELIRKSNPMFVDLAETWTYERLGPAQSIAGVEAADVAGEHPRGPSTASGKDAGLRSG